MFLPDTVIHRDCFKHHSERGEGPQLDQEEMTASGCSLVVTWHRGLEGLPQHTHPSCCLPRCPEWGGEGKVSISQEVCSHFPEAQCHQQKSLKAGFSSGCTLETRPWPAVWWKISNSLSLASGKTWPFFGGAAFPLCPDGIKVWTALLVVWSSRSNEQVPSVLLLPQQNPQNFYTPKCYRLKRENRDLTSLVLMYSKMFQILLSTISV